MKRAVAYVTAIIASLIVTQAVRGRATEQEQQDQKRKIGYDASREGDSTTVEYFVMRARENGWGQIIYPSPISRKWEVKGLDDVVDNFSAFVLTPQEKTSQIAFLGNGLETLYRCKITETLNLNKKAACCAAKDLRKLVRNTPTEIPEGEIYLYTWGGRIVVDGIEVIQEAFPTSLRVGRAYLVFLAHDEPAKVGMPLLGEEGIYEVRVDGRFVSKSPTSIPLANEIREKFDNSSQRLKDYIERRRAAIK